jgi:hypothetical protein
VGLAGALARARREVSVIDGVLEVFDEHYWQQAPACVVGSLCGRRRGRRRRAPPPAAPDSPPFAVDGAASRDFNLPA